MMGCMDHRPIAEQYIDAMLDAAALSVRQLVRAVREGAAAGLALIGSAFAPRR
jgi:hypothetical protein